MDIAVPGDCNVVQKEIGKREESRSSKRDWKLMENKDKGCAGGRKGTGF